MSVNGLVTARDTHWMYRIYLETHLRKMATSLQKHHSSTVLLPTSRYGSPLLWKSFFRDY